ncbi:unnamed protein product [Penicillium roqueforti FM164]|uniref:Genomic scaffold, ProqFM164S03 n=1 Tax=Penicillium roqueforti (strain FM164) TaxID=1365484 RepID=W6QKH1_PENRF|nr:unnamed protein product [Penicillium roqueforti FM164]
MSTMGSDILGDLGGREELPSMMIRSRCTVQWTSENLCHRWHGRCLYPEMPRVIGGLLGSRWARQESSGAGQRPGC